MTNANNDVRELEDLLTELEGQGALPAGPYSDEDDAVTQLMDAPLGEHDWMVQITAHDRRMMSTDQLLAELATGNLVRRDTLVWRATMSDWAPVARVDELANAAAIVPMAPERRPLPPPPAPIPPTRLPSGTMVSPGAPPSNGMAQNGALASNGVASAVFPSAVPSPPPLSSTLPSNEALRTPLPPMPSAPYGAPKLTPVPGTPYGAQQLTPVPLTPVPDVPPPVPQQFSNSGFGSPGVSPIPPAPPPPEPPSTFNVPLPAAAPAPPTMRASTPRPVAVDFSEMEPVRSTPAKILVGSGLAALAMIVGTVYALSAGGVFDVNAEASPATTPSSEPVAAKPAEAKPAADQPAEEKAPAEKAPDEKVAEAKLAAPSSDSESKNEPQTQRASATEEVAAEPESKASASKPSRVSSKEKLEDEPMAKADPASDGSAEEAGEATRGSRAERRMAARLRKRATAEATSAGAGAAAPRRSKPSAAPAATSAAAVEADDEAAKGGDTPGSTFNKQAAKSALDDAAAKARNCRPQGGPSGSGRVQVRYEPTGKVGEVSILTPQFDNTTTGSCVVMVFRRANIPAFTGSPAVVMNKNFEIP